MTTVQEDMLEQFGSLFYSENAVQKEAFKMLKDVGLPSKKSELYKYTPIVDMLAKKANLSNRSGNSFDHSFRYAADGHHIVVIDGKLSPENSSTSGLQVSVGNVTAGKHDPFSLVNTAFSNEEILIEGAEKNIFIYHHTTNGFSSPRVRVKVAQGQSINIVEKFISHLGNAFTNSFIHFEVASNAKATYSKVQDYGNSINHETVSADVQRDGRFYTNIYSFSGAMVRNNIFIDLDGENGEGHMYGLFLLDDRSHVDNNTSVDHIQPNSFSNELYKGILDGRSTGVFNGKIYVRQAAQKTNAFQTNNNILLSKEATLNTKPQLEIWADDVKCSHGCTSGQLDEDALFYLRARGIDERSAKKMLLRAFAEDALSEIPVDEIRQEVKEKIEQRLS